MGSIQKQHIYTIESSQSLPPINNPETPNQPTSNTGFPILAIAVLCIMATAFLLVIYYILLTKCCLSWQQIDPLRRFSFSRSRRNEDLLMAYSPSWQCHGLDDILIREIPTFQYTKLEGGERSLFECVVCLNEFQEQDMLRILPHCGHGFHLDCIDVWLQSNAKCPLCRSSISGTNRYPTNRIVAPTSSPQDPQPFLGGDEDYVVIELGGENRVSARNLDFSGKFEQKQRKVKARKFHHVSIMGDECIDVREKDERFSVQPLRRSFSMDSAADRHVYLAVQEIIRENGERNRGESSSRSRRLFFPFGNGRGSRSAILPVEF